MASWMSLRARSSMPPLRTSRGPRSSHLRSLHRYLRKADPAGMPLLVVPLDTDHASALTLAEWDALLGCERVLFERADHPLVARLRSQGIEAGPLETDPSPSREGWALVTDETSPRVIE